MPRAHTGTLKQLPHLWNEVGAPYETAIARLGLGDACHTEGNEARAVLERRAARSVLQQMGVGVERARAGAAEPRVPAQPVSSASVFRREGDYWSIVFEEKTVRLRDLKGLHYLARLFAHPGREFHVLDLVAGENVEPGNASRAAEPGLMLLDAQAKAAYRRRLAEIEQDMDEARAMGDSGRVAQAETEREFLVRELSRAMGLGGRDRQAGSTSERARASVTRAVRQAMARIREQNPPLAEHLDRAIRTGTYCAYLPDSRGPVNWEL
jgi:hypothetical protein